MLDWNFLANLAVAYGSTSSVSDLMAEIEKRVVSEQVPQLRQGSKALVRLLEEEIPVEKGLSLNAVVNELGRHVALLKVSRSYSYLLMVGSDVMDALVIAWARASVELQNKLLVIVYRAFSRLLDDEDPKISLLLDQLYSLIATQKKTDKQSLLFQLAATTNLMRKLQKLAPGSNATRLRSFIAQMEGLGLMGNTRPKRLIRRKIGKEKKNDDEYGHGAMGYVHVHRMSLITQIQDVFPELGSGFIIKLLDEYDDATEQIITHLLEDSLPDHLKTADRTENMYDGPLSTIKVSINMFLENSRLTTQMRETLSQASSRAQPHLSFPLVRIYLIMMTSTILLSMHQNFILAERIQI